MKRKEEKRRQNCHISKFSKYSRLFDSDFVRQILFTCKYLFREFYVPRVRRMEMTRGIKLQGKKKKKNGDGPTALAGPDFNLHLGNEKKQECRNLDSNICEKRPREGT